MPERCDVIILTALPVECKAVLHFLQDPQEITHPSGTVYYVGSFTGIHRTWRVAVAEIGMGGVTAALEAEKAISFFHAKVTLFVGIAGGIKDVQRGDVVVATKVYAYESGKAGAERFAPRPELGHSSYALEQRARAEAHNDEWLDRLEDDRLGRVPQVYIGALAAGEKVPGSTRSDLAKLLRENYGDTLAIEMEGHGFLHAVRVNQMVYGLVIRGISDMVDDKAEADASGAQRIAAQHSAAFAFQVLAKFTPPSGYKSLSLLNLPFDRNPFFTGREAELQELHRRLHQNQSAAIGQKSAVSGLGGIGKTQVAVEYAYRYHEEYQYVLWARADSVESLNASYTELARLLELPEKQEKEQEIIVQAVKRWLQREQEWLLILDNADSPELLPDFLPSTIGGHLLITTRAAEISTKITGVGHALVVESFSEEQGALFLLHRAGLLTPDATLERAEPEMQQRAREMTRELGGLPLALNQAGAYIEATHCSLATYQQIYEKHHTQLLKERRSADYPESVVTTWNISFRSVEQQKPAAADLLRFCAFLAPDAIPEEILTKGAEALGDPLASVAADPFLLNGVIESLRAYSLMSRESQVQTLSVHRLVQAVVRDNLPVDVQYQWMHRAVKVLQAAHPGFDIADWPALEQWLSHALLCATWIEQVKISTPEAASLLNQAGYYLDDRARYSEAEPLYQRALAIREQQLGQEHPDTAQSLNNLALLYYTQGKYEQAKPLLKRALAIHEQQLGQEHLETTRSLNNLAELYRAQGKYSEAEPLYQRALAIREQQLGPQHPDTATSLNYLAGLYYDQGKYSEAEPLLKRALAIREQQLGQEHPSTATSLNNLAALYKNQGKYEQAEPLHQRALAIREQQLGQEHPDTATSLNNLALLYYTQGKYEQAKPLFLRALAIWEQQLGADHPSTAASLNNLALLYKIQGKYERAKPLFLRALHICEHTLGPQHPNTRLARSNYAALLRVMEQEAEAKKLESEGNE